MMQGQDPNNPQGQSPEITGDMQGIPGDLDMNGEPMPAPGTPPSGGGGNVAMGGGGTSGGGPSVAPMSARSK